MEAEVCILVHGFTGSPVEIRPLARALKESGYRVLTPLLPGHEGTKEDLRKATASAWIHSIDELVDANVGPAPVHLIGFSMGAMIASVIASRKPVTSLTLLAPSVYYARPRQVFRQMATYIKANWDKAGGDADYLKRRGDQFLAAPLYSLQQFRRLVQMARSAMPHIQVPTCVIQGLKDEIVEPQSADYVYNTVASAQKEVHYLPESRHMVCLDVEAEMAVNFVLKFLESVGQGLPTPALDHTNNNDDTPE